LTNQPLTSATIPVAIIGAAGYTGLELISILLDHPRAAIVGLFGSDRHADAPTKLISDIFPRLRRRCDLPVRPASPDAIADLNPRAAFLCTPHHASHDLAPHLLERGIVVLDLSAAFRLKNPALYPKHYAFEHRHPALLERAVYGLPELFRDRIARADLIAVPGCYPTSAILPLAPLTRARLLDPRTRPIVDSISGVSGAGRHPTLTNLFCEVSLQPYNVFTHRHNPEIDAYAGTPVIFTPHLGPYDRGILSTIHAQLAQGVDETRVRAALADAFAREQFIRLLPPGQWPSIAAVRNTNFCDLALAADSQGHLILASAIDNLTKGASGQAVQCMNVCFGFPETTGLHHSPSKREGS
jgi:N-acetyl-gamma-glutamyl-phosphate reductase